MKKKIVLGLVITILILAVIVEGFFLFKLTQDNKNKESKKEEVTKQEVTDQEKEISKPSTEKTKEPESLPSPSTVKGENLTISKKYSSSKGNEKVYTYMTVTIKDNLNHDSGRNER